jgi:hypothetical protein
VGDELMLYMDVGMFTIAIKDEPFHSFEALRILKHYWMIIKVVFNLKAIFEQKCLKHHWLKKAYQSGRITEKLYR